MAIGDVEMFDCGHGLREAACPSCGGVVEDCIVCDGEGVAYQIVAPEHEVAEIMENLRRQLPENKH